MGVFHFLKIVQIVQNHVKRLIFLPSRWFRISHPKATHLLQKISQSSKRTFAPESLSFYDLYFLNPVGVSNQVSIDAISNCIKSWQNKDQQHELLGETKPKLNVNREFIRHSGHFVDF